MAEPMASPILLAVSGRIGLWSKADSYVYFEGFAAKSSN
jgi:hypothetical protein